MSTVALNMIVKDEFVEVRELIAFANDNFNEINLTVSDKTTANKLKNNFDGLPYVHVKYREWTDNFADARNANYNLSTADWNFWLDADDQFDFSRIREIVEQAEAEEVDAVFLPYNYAFDNNGNVITRHWRERLTSNNGLFTWKGAVHETLIANGDFDSIKIDQPVNHQSKSHESSLQRNHLILEKAVEVDDPDPRDLCYLGASYFSIGDYVKCIETLLHYLEVGGSVEDAYRSMTLVSEAAYHLCRHDYALEYAMKCLAMKPEYPQGYWLLAQYEADQQNWKEALEWVKVSLTKPDPDTLAVFDPSARERAVLIGAQAEFMLENYNAALAYLRKIPNNENAKELIEDFQAEADKETFIKMLPHVQHYFHNVQSLYEGLTDDVRYDKRLRGLRNAATLPTAWTEKSIVIFCGQGYEEWGPSTLDKGMGGSEEAVVYLAPELAKLGYNVTVYGEANEDQMVSDKEGIGFVRWKNWREIDLRDTFNVFVSWRNPGMLEQVNAKVKLADIHDVLPEDLIKNYPDVTYLFKTEYHKNLYGPVTSKVIGNGIKKEQFNA